MPHTAALTSRSRRLALAVLCAWMLMVILDGSIVTVALPVIQSDLRFSATGLTWVVNAYLIAFGGLLLLAARLAQGIGGAATSAVSLGMIVTLFPEPGERGTAIGAFSFVGAAGASTAPVPGATLTQAAR